MLKVETYKTQNSITTPPAEFLSSGVFCILEVQSYCAMKWILRSTAIWQVFSVILIDIQVVKMELLSYDNKQHFNKKVSPHVNQFE